MVLIRTAFSEFRCFLHIRWFYTAMRVWSMWSWTYTSMFHQVRSSIAATTMYPRAADSVENFASATSCLSILYL